MINECPSSYRVTPRIMMSIKSDRLATWYCPHNISWPLIRHAQPIRGIVTDIDQWEARLRTVCPRGWLVDTFPNIVMRHVTLVTLRLFMFRSHTLGSPSRKASTLPSSLQIRVWTRDGSDATWQFTRNIWFESLIFKRYYGQAWKYNDILKYP